MSSPLKVLIADDEELGRRAVSRLIEKDERFEIVSECEDGARALEVLRSNEVDVAFLDVNMPGLDGMQVAESAPSGTHLVFVTAYEEFAVRAFDRAAVDYLVKPIHEARFAECLDRVCDRATPVEVVAAQKLTFKCGSSTFVCSSQEIVTIEAAGNYVLVQLSGEAAPTRIRATMKSVMEMMPRDVVQVHRAFAVGLAYVRELSSARSELCMSNGERVPVGRTYRAAVESRLQASRN